MKRLFSFILVLLLIFSLSACSIVFYRPQEDKGSNSKNSSEDTESISEIVDEIQSESTDVSDTIYLCDFIDKTVGDVKKSYNYQFKFGALEGGTVMYCSNPRFFFVLDNYYENPTNACRITMAVSQDSTELIEDLSGTMTYKEIGSVLGNKINLSAPERWYNEMDEIWTYSLSFEYKGLTFNYEWTEDPNTNKSINATVRKPIIY